jgi:diacylglycerol kinase
VIGSFKNAFRGIAFCIRYERNMRVHIVAALFITPFALFFYELTKAELLLLILTCALVITLEMLNTAIEVLTDKASPRYSVLAKIAKDTAAGAVLTAAAAAVVIGVILFWDLAKFGEIAQIFANNPLFLLLFILFVILSCVFIFSGKERKKIGKIRKIRKHD